MGHQSVETDVYIANTADGVRAESVLQYVASGGSGAFAGSNPSDKLISLVHSLKPRYRINAAWTMNTNTLEQIRTFKNSIGDYIWKAGLEAGQPDTLLGYPIFEDQSTPDISSNSLSIAFGDFKRGYVIVDRNTLDVARSLHCQVLCTVLQYQAGRWRDA